MKFICPECKTEDRLERILRGVVDTTPINIFNGEIIEGNNWLDYDAANKHFEYYCRECGYELPVTDRSECFEELEAYLEEQEDK